MNLKRESGCDVGSAGGLGPPAVALNAGDGQGPGRAASVREANAVAELDPREPFSGNRDAGAVCVVENSQDLMSLERSNAWHGVYHVLEGAISPLSGVGPSALRIAELLARVEAGGVAEVVIATNFTVEGEATALYLTKLLKPTGVRVTRLAHGIPLGSDIEFVDAATVQWALQGRNEL